MQATFYSRAREIIAAASLGLVLAMAAAPIASADTNATMSTEQQAQVSVLANKLLTVIKGLGPNASEGAIEGAMIDACEGYSAQVVSAAMAQVANTPGLAANATAAAKRLSRAYAQGAPSHGTGAIGFAGGVPGASGPGFGAGGGGGASSNYTH